MIYSSNRIKQFFVFSILSIFSLTAYGASWYVNPSSGNDANSGTSSGAAFKTFYKAYTVAASTGDFIYISSGTIDWTAAAEIGDAVTTGYTISKSLTIIGNGSQNTFIQAASTRNTADRRVFTFSANVTVKDLTIRYGKNTSSNGGGFYSASGSVTLENVSVESNYCSSGGGAAFISGVNLTLTKCTFYDNECPSFGAAFYVQQGIVTITNSTFTGNLGSSSIIAVENYNFAGYEINMTNVTVAYNTLTTTSSYHGHVYHAGCNVMRVKNCLFAKNSSPNTTKSDYLKYSSTAYTVAANNLIENDYNWAGYGLVNGVDSNIIGVQANLNLSSTLSANGYSSATKTLALGCGSPAINAGSANPNGTISVPTTDQRGASRSGKTDIGSFENNSSSEISTSGTLTSFSKCGSSPSSNQTFTAQGCNLTNNISISAPTGFEISTNASSGFASSLTLTQSSGTVAATTIYVRLTAGATGSPSWNIALTSTGATSVNLAVSGTVSSIAAGTASSSQIVCYNTTASNITSRLEQLTHNQ